MNDGNQIRENREDAGPIPCAPIDTNIHVVRSLRTVRHSKEKGVESALSGAIISYIHKRSTYFVKVHQHLVLASEF